MQNSIYVISYELKNTWFRNYKPLYDTLQSFPSWMHYIENTWLIETDLSAQQIFENLAPHVPIDSLLLITKIKFPYFGYLPKEAWDWLEQRRNLLS